MLDVLRNGRPRGYLFNAEAEGYPERVGVAAVTRRRLRHLPRDRVLDEPTLLGLLAEPRPGLGDQARTWVLDALAVAAYHAQAEGPVVRLLACDDAPRFTWRTEELALCRVHAGRHYKQMDPFLPRHRTALADFLKAFWAFSHEVLVYRQAPTSAERLRLATGFDRLVGQKTGYARLDERIASTRAKKAHLLLVLAHPEIELPNNPAELGARARVRKRDVSFGPRTAEGARAWDTFMTLAETAKKLGVSVYPGALTDRASGGGGHQP